MYLRGLLERGGLLDATLREGLLEATLPLPEGLGLLFRNEGDGRRFGGERDLEYLLLIGGDLDLGRNDPLCNEGPAPFLFGISTITIFPSIRPLFIASIALSRCCSVSKPRNAFPNLPSKY